MHNFLGETPSNYLKPLPTPTTMTPLPVLDGERVKLPPKEQVLPLLFFDKRTKNRDRRGYVIAIFLFINLAPMLPVLCIYKYIYILYYIIYIYTLFFALLI